MWRTVKLGDICMLNYGKALNKKDRLESAAIPVYGANGIKAYTDKFLHDKPSIIIGRKGSAGELNKVTKPFWALDVAYYVTTDDSIIDLDFLFYALVNLNLPSMAKGVKPGINRNDVYDKSIYLPSLPEQQRIVTKLDALFAEINVAIKTCKEQISETVKLELHSLTSLFSSDEFIMRRINEIAEIKGGKRLPKGKKLTTENTGFPYIRVSDFNENGSVDEESVQFVEPDVQSEISRYTISSKDVYVSIAGTIGKTGIVPSSLDNVNLTENAAKLVLKEGVDRDFVYFFTRTSSFEKQAIAQTRKAAQPKLSLERLGAVELPIYELPQQRQIAFDAKLLTKEIAKVIASFEEKLIQLAALKSSVLAQEIRPQPIESA